MSDHFLSERQKAEFDKQGFIALRGRIPPPLLQQLQTAASDLIAMLSRPGVDQTRVTLNRNGERFHIGRINNIFSFPKPEFLLLLGCPQLFEAAESLCGKNPLPIYESVMIHHLESHSYTAMHQDMIHDRASRIATFGIYLDDATPGDGSVRVIPGSHVQRHDLNKFEELRRNNNWKFHELEAKAGDLLIHDVMIIHDAPRLAKRTTRRTVYFEFRSLEHLLNNPTFSEAWIERCQETTRIARSKYELFLQGKPLMLTAEEKEFFDPRHSVPVQLETANYPYPIPNEISR
jgi:hypothetical protein